MQVNEALTKLLQGFAAIPYNKLLGLELDSLDHNAASMHFAMQDGLIGNFVHGILHGGVIASVLDMAGGIVVMASTMHKNLAADTLAERIAKCSTIDLHISYLQPGKGAHFTVKSWMIKSGNKIAFTRMELFNEDSVTIAAATGTYMCG